MTTTDTSPAAGGTSGTIAKHDGINSVFLTGPSDTDEQIETAKLVFDVLSNAGYQVAAANILVEHGQGTTVRAADMMASDADVITGESEAVAVLPGWEGSRTSRAHVAIARSIELPILDAITGDRLPEEEPETTRALRAHLAGAAVNAPVSVGETRVTSATGGAKGQKEARFDLLPPGPLKELAVLYGRGAIKYDETNEDANWKRGYAWSLSYAALLRHLQLWWNREEDYDDEMAVKHLTSVAWHAFNLMWFMENRTEFDDRPQGSKNPDGTMTGETYAGAQPTPQWIHDKLAAKAAATD